MKINYLEPTAFQPAVQSLCEHRIREYLGVGMARYIIRESIGIWDKDLFSIIAISENGDQYEVLVIDAR
jgi:hypothetical protein